MPSEGYELVRRTLERFEQGDRDYWRSVFALDVEWDVTADPILGKTHYRGHEGIDEFFSDWLGTWEDYAVQHEELLDAGDAVVAVFRQRGRGKGSGIEIDRRFYGVYYVRDGRIVRYRGFPSREEALAAAGIDAA